ncbi:MAG TPA: hypothetical protein VEG42_00755 [Thermoplasmata archaeon]|nr:hypothetical protein [Thermoplasmata archaeon]
MRANRVAILLWLVLIVVLLIVEIAEITRLFTIPVQNAIGDPLAFVIALVFTTLVALVGAIFIGVYFSHRILNPSGFTPFEEEMLRMRSDVQAVKRDVAELRGRLPGSAPPDVARGDDEEDEE